MEDRIAAYERLAYCFLVMPDEAFMQAMVAMGVADEDAPWYAAFSAFEGRIAEVGAQAALQELAVDRTRLFKGLTPDGPTPPYQSLYRPDDRSDTLANVNRLYREAGFALSPEVHDAPDQLGIELMYVAFLLRQHVERGCDAPLAAAKSFFNDDLAPFARAFAKTMADQARTDFFRGFTQLMEVFIDEETEAMA